MSPPVEGTTHRVERTFTHEDVRAFGQVTGDTQAIHTEPDEEGRLVCQGLLTASLFTDIGGTERVLATRMDYRFLEPVYTGQHVVCEWTFETVDEHEDRYWIAGPGVCTVADERVLEADVEGLIWKE